LSHLLTPQSPSSPPRPTPSLHDALPISGRLVPHPETAAVEFRNQPIDSSRLDLDCRGREALFQKGQRCFRVRQHPAHGSIGRGGDRKSTRLNSSHQIISYAVFCLKQKWH